MRISELGWLHVVIGPWAREARAIGYWEPWCLVGTAGGRNTWSLVSNREGQGGKWNCVSMWVKTNWWANER